MPLIPWKNKQRDEERGEGSPIATLRTEMDRLFDSFIRDPVSALEWPFTGRAWMPPVDVAENDQEVIVRAEIPGVRPEDLELTVSGNQLTLAGEKKEEREEKGSGFFQSESRYGSFRRVVSLPEGVDANQVEADYANGVLTVHLKKTASAAPKRISVKPK